jgi:hypothetical protein
MNAERSATQIGLRDRVTRLGEFSPFGRMFAYWAIVYFVQF